MFHPCCLLLRIAVCFALFGCAKAGESRFLPPLCPGCLREPVEADYFGAVGGQLGGELPRVHAGALASAFDQAARAGKVFLIENATVGTAMAGWTCERLAKEFPDAKMRREYDWVKNPEDVNVQTFGDKSWVETKEAGESAKDRLRLDPAAPPLAPFYWGVRDYRWGVDIGTQKVVQRIGNLIKNSVPKFMEQDNAEILFNNTEFWLGAKGTGARAHMDSHCISTLSVVLSGERRWRVGPVPRMPRGSGRSRDEAVVFDDGVAYAMKWKPMFEVVAREGDAVLFPPGWIHETLNTAEGCTVALTTQFGVPPPVRYYRSFYDRLRRIGDLYPCWGQMKQWASLGRPTNELPSNDAKARAEAEKLFKERGGKFSPEERDFYDIDEDGKVGHSEFVDTYAAWVATERAIEAEEVKEQGQLIPDMDLSIPAGHPDEL